MQYCSACQKSPATIMIMDLNAGNVTDQQHLCGPCAENLGIVQSKTQLKMSPEILEELLSTMQGKPAATARSKGKPGDCPGCGMTMQQFKTGGRLGCPRCYLAFRDDLVPLLQRVHEAASHRGRLPGGTPPALPATPVDDSAAEMPTPTAGDTASGDTAGGDAGLGEADPTEAADAQRRQTLADLRRKLDDAIRGERYEEAAQLRDELQREEGAGGQS